LASANSAPLAPAHPSQLAARINAAYPDHALAVKCDVSHMPDIQAAIQQTIAHFGRLDYAVNSAGLVVGGKTVTAIVDTDEASYDRIQSVDARGLFFCMREQLRVMKEQDVLDPGSARSSRGVIVNMASRASLEGVAKFGAYCAAKHAVLGMTRVAAVEHAKDRIRVIAMCPGEFTVCRVASRRLLTWPLPARAGLITTPGHVQAAKEVDDMLLAKVPMSRFGVPEEIVDGVTWLLSDMSSFMTGTSFEIDGGSAAL